jgi:hypothetical protein
MSGLRAGPIVSKLRRAPRAYINSLERSSASRLEVVAPKSKRQYSDFLVRQLAPNVRALGQHVAILDRHA